MAVNVKITDVAKAAGISQSTASFVLSGRGDEMHISKETQEQVWKAARELDYHPSNLSRRIRKNITVGVPTVTIFWSVGQNHTNLARAFTALQDGILRKNFNLQFVLKPFFEGHLLETLKKTAVNYFNGAIIGGASAKDLEDLSGMEPRMPIVFFERNLPGYHSVYTNQNIGVLLAEKMIRRNIDSAVMICPFAPGPAIQTRMAHLTEVFPKYNISLRSISLESQSYLQDSKELTYRIMSQNDAPKLLFYHHEEDAVGGIDALRELGLQHSGKVEVAVYGSSPALDYLGMPVTRFSPKIETLVDATLDLLIQQIEDDSAAPQNIAVDCQCAFAGKLR